MMFLRSFCVIPPPSVPCVVSDALHNENKVGPYVSEPRECIFWEPKHGSTTHFYIAHRPRTTLTPRDSIVPPPHAGLDHLLYGGRGAGGQREEADELHVACFMGLVSFLAGKNEVLRVSPWEKKFTLNSSARANIQSGTVTATPLTDAGLDGTGEIIQVGGWMVGDDDNDDDNNVLTLGYFPEMF